MRDFLARAAVIVAAVAACLLAAACGPKSLSVKALPFPSDKPVFVGVDGTPARELPAGGEPLRLVVLDFPWCSACAEAWKAVGVASRSVPAGTVRVYRIVFDRERLFEGSREREVPPLRPAPPANAGAFPVTTLTAIPSAFRQQYRVEEAPVLLLLDRGGRVAARWSGSFPALAAGIAGEINRLLAADRRPGT